MSKREFTPAQDRTLERLKADAALYGHDSEVKREGGLPVFYASGRRWPVCENGVVDPVEVQLAAARQKRSKASTSSTKTKPRAQASKATSAPKRRSGA